MRVRVRVLEWMGERICVVRVWMETGRGPKWRRGHAVVTERGRRDARDPLLVLVLRELCEVLRKVLGLAW
jgi:hypothetical protein